MTPGLALGYDRETEIAEDFQMCGGKLKDYGISHDLSGGVHGVRLAVGQRDIGVHLPSPRLTRRDVRALWWMTRGRAAVPDRLDAWWASLSELDREGMEQCLGALSLLSWLDYWWGASVEPIDEDGDQPSQPSPPVHDQDRPDVRS